MAKVFEQFGSSREDALYFFWLFLVAAALSFLLLVREKKKTGKKVAVSEMTAGILVGIPNYFSSYFLLRALEQFPASLAFSVFSTGTSCWSPRSARCCSANACQRDRSPRWA